MVEVTLPQSQDDADERYLDAWELLRQAPPRDAAAGAANPAARAKDYYATVRSNVLLAWIMSNGGLAIGICVISNTSVQILYMGVLLYSAAAIAAIKLLGTIIYLYVHTLPDARGAGAAAAAAADDELVARTAAWASSPTARSRARCACGWGDADWRARSRPCGRMVARPHPSRAKERRRPS